MNVPDKIEIDFPPFEELFVQFSKTVCARCPKCHGEAGKLKDDGRWVCKSGTHGFYAIKDEDVLARNVYTRTRIPLDKLPFLSQHGT